MLASEIREKALSLGFGDVGFTDAAPFTRWATEMERRKRTEAAMRPVWERYRIASDPLTVMPEAKTIVVLAWPYRPYGGEWPEGHLRWSAYYECRGPAREAMGVLTEWLRERGVTALEANDQLPLKEAAQRAGLGRIGRNQLLITPRWGSCVYLGAVLFDTTVAEKREPVKPLDCDTCRRCAAACPTGALTDDGLFHRKKCLRHYMLLGDTIPETVRGLLGNDLVGCDTCQRVCPHNHGQYKGERTPEPDMISAFCIADILEEWQSGLKNRMARMAPVIGGNYARATKVLSAALIAARKYPELTSAIGRALAHPAPRIRKYAAWALSYHPYEEAGELLGNALTGEADSEVRKEITAALDRMAGAGEDID